MGCHPSSGIRREDAPIQHEPRAILNGMSVKVTLMRQQRNSIFKLIEYSTLDPKDFRLEQVQDQASEFPQITHVPTDSYFRFGMDFFNDTETSEWSPGRNVDDDSGPA